MPSGAWTRTLVPWPMMLLVGFRETWWTLFLWIEFICGVSNLALQFSPESNFSIDDTMLVTPGLVLFLQLVSLLTCGCFPRSTINRSRNHEWSLRKQRPNIFDQSISSERFFFVFHFQHKYFCVSQCHLHLSSDSDCFLSLVGLARYYYHLDHGLSRMQQVKHFDF